MSERRSYCILLFEFRLGSGSLLLSPLLPTTPTCPLAPPSSSALIICEDDSTSGKEELLPACPQDGSVAPNYAMYEPGSDQATAASVGNATSTATVSACPATISASLALPTYIGSSLRCSSNVSTINYAPIHCSGDDLNSNIHQQQHVNVSWQQQTTSQQLPEASAVATLGQQDSFSQQQQLQQLSQQRSQPLVEPQTQADVIQQQQQQQHQQQQQQNFIHHQQQNNVAQLQQANVIQQTQQQQSMYTRTAFSAPPPASFTPDFYSQHLGYNSSLMAAAPHTPSYLSINPASSALGYSNFTSPGSLLLLPAHNPASGYASLQAYAQTAQPQHSFISIPTGQTAYSAAVPHQSHYIAQPAQLLSSSGQSRQILQYQSPYQSPSHTAYQSPLYQQSPAYPYQSPAYQSPTYQTSANHAYLAPFQAAVPESQTLSQSLGASSTITLQPTLSLIQPSSTSIAFEPNFSIPVSTCNTGVSGLSTASPYQALLPQIVLPQVSSQLCTMNSVLPVGAGLAISTCAGLTTFDSLSGSVAQTLTTAATGRAIATPNLQNTFPSQTLQSPLKSKAARSRNALSNIPNKKSIYSTPSKRKILPNLPEHRQKLESPKQAVIESVCMMSSSGASLLTYAMPTFSNQNITNPALDMQDTIPLMQALQQIDAISYSPGVSTTNGNSSTTLMSENELVLSNLKPEFNSLVPMQCSNNQEQFSNMFTDKSLNLKETIPLHSGLVLSCTEPQTPITNSVSQTQDHSVVHSELSSKPFNLLQKSAHSSDAVYNNEPGINNVSYTINSTKLSHVNDISEVQQHSTEPPDEQQTEKCSEKIYVMDLKPEEDKLIDTTIETGNSEQKLQPNESVQFSLNVSTANSSKESIMEEDKLSACNNKLSIVDETSTKCLASTKYLQLSSIVQAKLSKESICRVGDSTRAQPACSHSGGAQDIGLMVLSAKEVTLANVQKTNHQSLTSMNQSVRQLNSNSSIQEQTSSVSTMSSFSTQELPTATHSTTLSSPMKSHLKNLFGCNRNECSQNVAQSQDSKSLPKPKTIDAIFQRLKVGSLSIRSVSCSTAKPMGKLNNRVQPMGKLTNRDQPIAPRRSRKSFEVKKHVSNLDMERNTQPMSPRTLIDKSLAQLKCNKSISISTCSQQKKNLGSHVQITKAYKDKTCNNLNSKSDKPVRPPERIVIKMKMLHGSLSPNNTEGTDQFRSSTAAVPKNDTSPANYSEWKIDSIVKTPTLSPTKSIGKIEALNLDELKMKLSIQKTFYNTSGSSSCEDSSGNRTTPADSRRSSADCEASNYELTATDSQFGFTVRRKVNILDTVKQSKEFTIGNCFVSRKPSTDSCSDSSSQNASRRSSADSDADPALGVQLVLRKHSDSDTYSCVRTHRRHQTLALVSNVSPAADTKSILTADADVCSTADDIGLAADADVSLTAGAPSADVAPSADADGSPADAELRLPEVVNVSPITLEQTVLSATLTEIHLEALNKLPTIKVVDPTLTSTNPATVKMLNEITVPPANVEPAVPAWSTRKVVEETLRTTPDNMTCYISPAPEAGMTDHASTAGETAMLSSEAIFMPNEPYRLESAITSSKTTEPLPETSTSMREFVTQLPKEGTAIPVDVTSLPESKAVLTEHKVSLIGATILMSNELSTCSGETSAKSMPITTKSIPLYSSAGKLHTGSLEHTPDDTSTLPVNKPEVLTTEKSDLLSSEIVSCLQSEPDPTTPSKTSDAELMPCKIGNLKGQPPTSHTKVEIVVPQSPDADHSMVEPTNAESLMHRNTVTYSSLKEAVMECKTTSDGHQMLSHNNENVNQTEELKNNSGELDMEESVCHGSVASSRVVAVALFNVQPIVTEEASESEVDTEVNQNTSKTIDSIIQNIDTLSVPKSQDKETELTKAPTNYCIKSDISEHELERIGEQHADKVIYPIESNSITDPEFKTEILEEASKLTFVKAIKCIDSADMPIVETIPLLPFDKEYDSFQVGDDKLKSLAASNIKQGHEICNIVEVNTSSEPSIPCQTFTELIPFNRKNDSPELDTKQRTMIRPMRKAALASIEKFVNMEPSPKSRKRSSVVNHSAGTNASKKGRIDSSAVQLTSSNKAMLLSESRAARLTKLNQARSQMDEQKEDLGPVSRADVGVTNMTRNSRTCKVLRGKKRKRVQDKVQLLNDETVIADIIADDIVVANENTTECKSTILVNAPHIESISTFEPPVHLDQIDVQLVTPDKLTKTAKEISPELNSLKKCFVSINAESAVDMETCCKKLMLSDVSDSGIAVTAFDNEECSVGESLAIVCKSAQSSNMPLPTASDTKKLLGCCEKKSHPSLQIHRPSSVASVTSVDSNSSDDCIYTALPSSIDSLLPCSVSLCNVFLDWTMQDECCPGCSRELPATGVSVNTATARVQLTCLSCDWLVVKQAQPMIVTGNIITPMAI